VTDNLSDHRSGADRELRARIAELEQMNEILRAKLETALDENERLAGSVKPHQSDEAERFALGSLEGAYDHTTGEE